MKTNRILLPLVLLLMVTTAFADPISYQARLTDEAGEPLTGEHALSFSLFYEEEGGSAVWTEAHNPTLDADGLFFLLLGEGSPLDSLLGSDNPGPAWFEITVDGETLSPRRRVASASRAYLSQDAQKLGGMEPGEFAMGAHAHDDRYPTHLVLENSDGDGPNAGTPRVHWDVLHGVPATFVDGSVNWNELVGVPQGFADNVDNVGSGGGTLDAAYDYGGAGAGRTIYADDGYVEIAGSGGLSVNRDLVMGGIGGSECRIEMFLPDGTKTVQAIADSTYGGTLLLTHSDGDWSCIFGEHAGGGNLSLSGDGGGTIGADLTGNGYQGGTFYLVGDNPLDYVYMSPGDDVGDKVELPGASIESDEILDEPGIARNCSSSPVSVPSEMWSYTNVIQVTITLPRAGYVNVRASGTVALSGVMAGAVLYAQIDTTSTGSVIHGQHKVGPGEMGSGDLHYHAVSLEDVFYRQAGSHTFYFLAICPIYPTGAVTIEYPTITAIYLPTSYGSVASYPSTARAAEPVDLRDLELRDSRAQVEAERARRELLEARLADRNREDRR